MFNARTIPRCHQVYDHRLRELVFETGDASLATRAGVPRSTAAGWLAGRFRDVRSLDVVDKNEIQLQVEVLKLRRRVRVLTAVLGLLLAVLRVSGFRLQDRRLPEGKAKARLLRAIDRARDVLPVKAALRVLGLSSARYHAWQRAEQRCELDDRPSCPRSRPAALRAGEIAIVHEMATDENYRHLPLRRLALYAQRIGAVVASPSTWAKLVRERGWLRPRRRVYPQKPREGVRARQPNQYWHVDVTILKLLDGTRAYIHGIADNFSRRVLAWRVAERLEPGTTRELLIQAAENANLEGDIPTLVADSGVENVNGEVDELISSGLIKRVLALVEVDFSNSIVEAFWRSLKHNWLYLNHLQCAEIVRRLVAFYVEQHNTVPHSSFKGQSPDEIYFGAGGEVTEKLAAAGIKVRQERLEANRSASCAACRAA